VVAVGAIPATDVFGAKPALVLDAAHVPVWTRRVGVSLAVVALAIQERRVNANSFAKLERLAAECADILRDKSKYSHRVFRGAMWAIISAHHDIKKVREKAQRKQAVASASAVSLPGHDPNFGRVETKGHTDLPLEPPAPEVQDTP
jgi:hypothetical protein